LKNYFVAKREKRGVALTMSIGKWERIAVKAPIGPAYKRLKGIVEVELFCS
jgi:hypothetical protein